MQGDVKGRQAGAVLCVNENTVSYYLVYFISTQIHSPLWYAEL